MVSLQVRHPSPVTSFHCWTMTTTVLVSWFQTAWARAMAASRLSVFLGQPFFGKAFGEKFLCRLFDWIVGHDDYNLGYYL